MRTAPAASLSGHRGAITEVCQKAAPADTDLPTGTHTELRRRPSLRTGPASAIPAGTASPEHCSHTPREQTPKLASAPTAVNPARSFRCNTELDTHSPQQETELDSS